MCGITQQTHLSVMEPKGKMMMKTAGIIPDDYVPGGIDNVENDCAAQQWRCACHGERKLLILACKLRLP